MNKKYFYSALFFCVSIYLLTFVYKLPASLLKPTFDKSRAVSIDKLSGTVWNGSIANLSIKIDKGFINVGQLNWQLRPFCFITLKVCARLQLSPNTQSQGDIYVSTDAQANLREVLTLRHTDVDIDATWLMEMSALPISAVGRMMFKSEQMTFSEHDRLPSIVGELRWQKAGIDYPEEYALGNYIVAIATLEENENKAIQGVLRDENGLISSNGTIDITTGGKVDININVRATPQTPDSLASTLGLIGQADPQGNYNIRHKTFLKTIL